MGIDYITGIFNFDRGNAEDPALSRRLGLRRYIRKL